MSAASVAGVGMIKFSKPGTQEPYPAMAPAAVRHALGNASLSLADVGQAFAVLMQPTTR